MSVVICTHNRGSLLETTLSSIQSQILAETVRWEVLIVDNRSTDATKATVCQFIDTNPSLFRYVFEEKLGLSHARNAGIVNSQGKYICFFDDDTILMPNCLSAIYKTFIKYDADCVGGKILPKWPGRQPEWFIEPLYGDLACLNLGDNELIINDHKRTFFGANISFSRRAFERHGHFDIRLGRKGKKLYMSEESDMFERVVKVGGIAVYQPAAAVMHIVGERRTKKSYFRKLHFEAGEHTALLSGQYRGKNFLGIPLYMFYNFFKSSLRFIRSFIFLSRETFFRELLLWNFVGYMKGRLIHFTNDGNVL